MSVTWKTLVLVATLAAAGCCNGGRPLEDGSSGPARDVVELVVSCDPPAVVYLDPLSEVGESITPQTVIGNAGPETGNAIEPLKISLPRDKGPWSLRLTPAGKKDYQDYTAKVGTDVSPVRLEVYLQPKQR